MTDLTVKELRTRAWNGVKYFEEELLVVHECYTAVFENMEDTDTIPMDKLTLGLLLQVLSTALGDITHPNFPNVME